MYVVTINLIGSKLHKTKFTKIFLYEDKIEREDKIALKKFFKTSQLCKNYNLHDSRKN